MLIIGDEILSGRTREGNLAYLAAELGKIGIVVAEARIVADDHDAIIAALNALRGSVDHVFTSGGIANWSLGALGPVELAPRATWSATVTGEVPPVRPGRRQP